MLKKWDRYQILRSRGIKHEAGHLFFIFYMGFFKLNFEIVHENVSSIKKSRFDENWEFEKKKTGKVTLFVKFSVPG